MNDRDYFAEIEFWPVHSGLGTYLTGFVVSLLLTLGAYWLAVAHALAPGGATGVLMVFALLQFLVQATCFLHMAGKGASRERLVIFAVALVVVFILVAGSLWIMMTLNGRMMSSGAQMEHYMSDQSGI